MFFYHTFRETMPGRRGRYDNRSQLLGTALTSVIALYSNWNNFLYMCIEKITPSTETN